MAGVFVLCVFIGAFSIQAAGVARMVMAFFRYPVGYERVDRMWDGWILVAIGWAVAVVGDVVALVTEGR